ncbi:hypothetical protein KP806_07855 [Paenibacillus sp. N4]|uniref:hypothetical protein n=1 Tax=Paenibacillus vietnamensis TaxID=2590547 RepID=UPI001CD112FD|nr:hypothetical protein [Paenibacillus vietnamensis]MCA0754962.1 hypothetical protein [Paenibacillus vietnamensis]
MNNSQLRAYDLTANFFHTFRSVRYKHVPVVRAMAYPFHLKAVKSFRGSKRTGLRFIRSPRQMYDRLVASDHITAVPYKAGRTNAKTIFSSLVIDGLGVSMKQNIVCIEKKNRRRLKAPYYNPEASGRLQTGQYNRLLGQIKSIVRTKGVHPYFKRKAFMIWIKPQLRSVMRKIDGIDQLLSGNNIKAIVQSSSVNPMGYLLVHMGRQRRIPTLNIQYGLIDTYQILSTNADHYVAWGEQHRKRLTRYGTPYHKFHLIGNPRFDSIFNGRWISKSQLMNKMGLNGSKTVFVYPEQPLKMKHNRIVMQRIIRALLPYRKQVALLVKRHPRQKSSGLSPGMMRKYPFAKLIRNRSLHLYDLLNSADAVFVQFSTTGLEAMLFRKPVIALAFFPNTNKHEYSYYASSNLIASARRENQLRTIVSKYMNKNSYRSLMLNQQQKYLLGAYSGNTNARKSIKKLMASIKGSKIDMTTAVIPVRADAYCPDFLIEQTIQAAQNSRMIQHIVLATDRTDLPANIVQNNVEIKTMTLNDPLLYSENGSYSELCLQVLQQNSSAIDLTEKVVILPPAFPSRTGTHIARALQLFNAGSADTLISLSPSTEAEAGSSFNPNGAIVITKASALQQYGNMPDDKVMYYKMNSESSFEVVTEEDAQYAQANMLNKTQAVRLKRRKRRKRISAKKRLRPKRK